MVSNDYGWSQKIDHSGYQQGNGYFDQQQQQNELHSVYGQIHAGPHPVPTHSDYLSANGNNPNTKIDNESGAFVAAGTAGNQGFDLNSLGLTEQEMSEAGLNLASFGGGGEPGAAMLPLNQYKINYDPNPIIIRRQIPVEPTTYKQQVIVRYLQPPTPPPPGPLIIKEVRPPQPQPAPPLIIRTRAPRGKTPPPIIIREQPPTQPFVDQQARYVTRMLPPQFQQQQQQQPFQQQQQYYHHQQREEVYNQNGTLPSTVNYDNYANGGNRFNNIDQNNQSNNNWITEVVNGGGSTSNVQQNLLDDVYRAMNNKLPRL